MNIDRELVRAAEASQMLSVSRRQLDQLVTEGKLPAPVMIDRIPRWRVAELRAWLANLPSAVRPSSNVHQVDMC